jgi:cbb3-type cytochrome oxidase subunit 3
MVALILFIFIVAYTIMIYFRNKQNDRARHRRERLQEKQEELMESLRKNKNSDED